MKHKFEIQSGIPVPSRKDAIYPWVDMLDGDSFFIAATGDEQRTIQRRVYTSGNAWAKRNKPDAKIVTRIEKEGVRIWMEVE